MRNFVLVFAQYSLKINIEFLIFSCPLLFSSWLLKITDTFNLISESSNDRNCSGCQTCCLDYPCWLKTQDILYTIINDTLFDVIVTLCIILNTVFLAIEHHGMSEDLQYVLDLGNKVPSYGTGARKQYKVAFGRLAFII